MAAADKIDRALGPKEPRAAWPPSNMPMGIRLSMVTSMPSQPAKATGCGVISNPGLFVGLGGGVINNVARKSNNRGIGRVL